MGHTLTDLSFVMLERVISDDILLRVQGILPLAVHLELENPKSYRGLVGWLGSVVRLLAHEIVVTA